MKETAKGTSGWVVETLFVHFTALLNEAEKKNEQRFIDQEKAVKAALNAAEQAVNKAEHNAEKWRANANEWRQAMDDREVKFMPRPEAERGLEANADKIGALTDRINRSEGHGKGLNTGWGYLIGAVGLALTIIYIFSALKAH